MKPQKQFPNSKRSLRTKSRSSRIKMHVRAKAVPASVLLGPPLSFRPAGGSAARTNRSAVHTVNRRPAPPKDHTAARPLSSAKFRWLAKVRSNSRSEILNTAELLRRIPVGPQTIQKWRTDGWFPVMDFTGPSRGHKTLLFHWPSVLAALLAWQRPKSAKFVGAIVRGFSRKPVVVRELKNRALVSLILSNEREVDYKWSRRHLSTKR